MKLSLSFVSLGLLASLSMPAASVTYTASNFTVTTPDFLNVVYPNALVNGFGSYVFLPGELSSCGRSGQTCTQAGFVVQSDPVGFAIIPYITVLVPDNGFGGGQTVTENSGYLIGANLNAVGDYSKPGFGVLVVSQSGAGPSAVPEPGTWFLMAAGLLLVAPRFIWKRIVRSAAGQHN